MRPLLVGLVVFALTFGGALAGIALRRRLPRHHLTDESRDAIKLGIGLIATMSALVLGLVTASAKSGYDSVNAGLQHAAGQLLSLDRALARYGPETQAIRRGLKEAVAARVDAVWPAHGAGTGAADALKAGVAARAEGLAAAIGALAPRDDAQRLLKDRAAALAESLLEDRWLTLHDSGESVPVPFLVALAFWLAISFTSFGLFAPPNATVVTVLFVCAASVASAIFLVLEMESPFAGLLKVSPEPLRQAIGLLGL